MLILEEKVTDKLAVSLQTSHFIPLLWTNKGFLGEGKHLKEQKMSEMLNWHQTWYFSHSAR